jgi:hypothetical protein
MVRSFNPYVLGIVALTFAVFASSRMALAQTAFNVDHKSVASADHTVDTLTGEITCAAGDSAVVAADVIQAKSGTIGFGITATLTCTGSSQSWSLDVPVVFPATGEYDNGPATAVATGEDVTAGTFLEVVDGIVITGANNH